MFLKQFITMFWHSGHKNIHLSSRRPILVNKSPEHLIYRQTKRKHVLNSGISHSKLLSQITGYILFLLQFLIVKINTQKQTKITNDEHYRTSTESYFWWGNWHVYLTPVYYVKMHPIPRKTRHITPYHRHNPHPKKQE